MLMFSAKLFTIVSAVLAVAVNGSPVEVARDEPQHALGNVSFCVDSGGCKQVPVDTNVCKNMPSDFDKKIGSFHPDKNFVCTLFEDTNCGGKSVPLKYPGNDHLSDVSFDKLTSSFKCAPPTA